MDKTRFVRALENVRFAFFVRPRRFGKTLWLTMLDAYYNRNVADEFETVFAGTDAKRDVYTRTWRSITCSYLGDDSLRKPACTFATWALVYHGWQLAHAEAVEGDE